MQDTVQHYFGCIESRDYAGVILLFAPNAKINSPFKPQMRADAFLKKWFSKASCIKIKLLNVMTNVEQRRVVAQFIYEGVDVFSKKVTFEAIDIFQFDATSKKIVSLDIQVPNYCAIKNLLSV
jgi:hypothetical protein